MTDPAVMRAAVALALGIAPGAGGARAAGDLSAEESSAVVSLLASNKVSLLALFEAGEGADPLRSAVAASPAGAATILSARARRQELIDAYRPVAEALAASGIRPVLFKSAAPFPYLSSNLDVLVPPSRFEESARIVAALGHIRFPHYREDHKLLFRTFERGRPGLSVHLHECVSWGKIVVADGEEVAARSVGGEEPWLRVSSPADALTATLAHSILETDEVRLSDLRTVRRCLARGARVTDFLAEARERRWEAAASSSLFLYDAVCRAAGAGPLIEEADRDRAVDALARSAWARRSIRRVVPTAGVALPHRTPRWFSKGHLVALIAGDDRREPDRRVRDLAASGWNLVANRLAIRCRPAQLITISGPDGAGKSRLAESVERTLRLCEVPVARLWSRGGFSRMAVSGKALARRVASGRIPAARDEEAKRAFLSGRWRRSLWTWAVVLEQAASLQRARLALAAGRTIICDRYAYDALADLLGRSPDGGRSLPARAAGFLLGAAPAPDIAFLIDVNAEIAHARKEDGTTLESRRRLAGAYRTIAGAAPFVRLDGDLPFDEMAQQAIDASVRRTFDAFARDRA
ncbi:MAG: nucleotidyltransferase family protein [Acidobacteria bacterium]|nr:nucleotidyltransferase family protein [Acidobacteriota bacterium]